MKSLHRQDLNSTAGPNKIKRLRLHPSITHPGPSNQHPQNTPLPLELNRSKSSKQPKHPGRWFTDLEPRIKGSVSRFKLRGFRLVDAETGLLGLVAGSRSIWVEGVGLGVAVLAAWTGAGNGRFICVRCGGLQLICYAGRIDPTKVAFRQEVQE